MSGYGTFPDASAEPKQAPDVRKLIARLLMKPDPSEGWGDMFRGAMAGDTEAAKRLGKRAFGAAAGATNPVAAMLLQNVPEPKNVQEGLDMAALGLAPVPVAGDIAGLAADAHMYATDPESRTWGNAAMTGAGLLPWVPSAAALKTVGGAGLMGIMAGVGAKTADLKALEKAKSLASSGTDRADVLKETGWFQGADGQWRFEIPDDQSQIGLRHQGYFSELGETSGAARAVLEHPALYEAYPDLGKIRIDATRTPNRRGGQHAYGDDETITVRAPDAHNLRSVGLHELQHAVQLREGFAPGGSAAEMGTRLPDAQAVSDAQVLQSLVRRGTAPEDAPAAFLNLLGRDVHPAARHMYMRNTPDEVHYMDPTNAYRALAGEVEARNVQSRMGMNADQLRATPPWETQDIPDQQQIIRRLLGGS